MSRTAQINYQRVTFSFPAKTLEKLRRSVPKNGMSKYVVDLVEENLSVDKRSSKDILASIKVFRETAKYIDHRSSLEILRKMRYGGKY